MGTKKTGLIVTGRTPLDNNSIQNMIDTTDLFGVFDAMENYFFFPEEEDLYDSLEEKLNEEFSLRDIHAQIEGVF